MKIFNIKFLCILFLSIFLYSCENDEVITNTSNSEFETKNGYIEFKSINEYKKTYEKISTLSEDELREWRNNLPFQTLESVYENANIPTYIPDSTNEDNIYKLNTKRLNPTLASLYNKDGILVINDTIYKIKNEFLYKITNGDLKLINQIDKNSISNWGAIQKELHTIRLTPTKQSVSNELLKNISDRTMVFYVSSTRREFMAFDAYVSGAYIRFEQNGQFQTKTIFWLPNAADEFVYAKINANGTFGPDNINLTGPTFSGIKSMGLQFFIGSPAVTAFDLNITYYYKKTNSTAYLNSWRGTSTTTEGSFTRNYKNINF